MVKSTRLLTVQECEAMTGRKASTWRRDILERRIAYLKLGRQVRIPIEVVQQLIDQSWRHPIQGGP